MLDLSASLCHHMSCEQCKLTLSRWFKTRRCLWMRTYLGHFTNRCRSCFGAGVPPTPGSIDAHQLAQHHGCAHQACVTRNWAADASTQLISAAMQASYALRLTKSLLPLLEERVDCLCWCLVLQPELSFVRARERPAVQIAVEGHRNAGLEKGRSTFLMAAGAAATRFPLGACDGHKHRSDNLAGRITSQAVSIGPALQKQCPAILLQLIVSGIST